MADNLRQRALAGDANALDALLEQERTASQEQEQTASRNRIASLEQRIVFQDKVIALKDANEVRFRTTIDNLCERIRMDNAEMEALRFELLTKACSSCTMRPYGCCAQQHKRLAFY